MIVLTVQWLANIGEEDKVKETFQKLAEASRKETGCQLYLVHQHRDNRRRFFLYELPSWWRCSPCRVSERRG